MKGKRKNDDKVLELILLFLIPLLFFCILYLPKGYASFPRNFFISCTLIAIPFFLRICNLWDKSFFLIGESEVALIFLYWLVVKIGLFPAWTAFSIFLLIAILVWLTIRYEIKNKRLEIP